MKKLITILTAVVLIASVFLPQQASAQFAYQAVIRNSSNQLVTNQTIGMKITILEGLMPNNLTTVYTEIQTPTTNANGLVTIVFGGNTGFSDIDWAHGIYWIRTETDPTGGTNYTITGRSILRSVPYANYATTAGNGYTSKDNSVFLGKGGGISSTGGYNVFIGDSAGVNNTTGYNNTAIGYQALSANTNGSVNTATGEWALLSNISGSYNTANGSGALSFNTYGSANTATGYCALFLNTTGSRNTAIGTSGLYNNTTGSYNTACGYQALVSNATGKGSTANGTQALYSNTIGNWNTASGDSALYRNISGYQNTANGYVSLFSNTTGNRNSAYGSLALMSNTSGHRNIAVGYTALYSSQTANDNTAVGYQALYSNTLGINNVAIGPNALYSNIYGSYNTAIGNNANVAADITNSTVIGNGAYVDVSNKIVIGDASATTVGGYGSWTNYSDRRLKENIIYTSTLGLNFITRLKPASYNYIKDTNKSRRDGFIAQDVEQVLKELGINFSGLIIDDNADKTQNLSYAEFVIPLVTAVQEQQKQIEAQNTTIANQQKQIDDLKLLVEKLIQK